MLDQVEAKEAVTTKEFFDNPSRPTFFAVLDPQNPSTDVSELNKIR